jgi:pimeloyl-ACP methyl ester carboxylesterase
MVLSIGVLFLIANFRAAAQEPSGAEDARGHGGVIKVGVCFTVHVPGNATAQTVRGDLYHSRRGPISEIAVLLQHGAVSDKTIWDPHPSLGLPSTARRLARAGYAAIAIDRLGYHTSPYSGSGFDLTAEAYVSMTNEMVQQMRNGTFLVTSGSCASGVPAGVGVDKVVLAGHSAGAGETMAYATRFHDIDGIMALDFATDERVTPRLEQLFGVLGPQLGAGQDYVAFFSDGENGYSQFCEDFAFHPPGVDPYVLKFACGDYFIDPAAVSPAGEVTTIASLMANARADIGNVGPTPVLLVWGDHDAVFPGPSNPDDGPDIQSAEIAFWSGNCNCEVKSFKARNSGHTVPFDRSARTVINRMIDFLDDEVAGR